VRGTARGVKPKAPHHLVGYFFEMAAQSHVTHLALGHAAMATPGAIHGVPMTFDTIKQIEMTQDANWVKCGN